MIIYLIGYKCSGKTTLGKILAEKLEMSFVDLDEYIEKKFDTSIPELFSTEGEIQFRQIERKAYFELGNEDNMVLSTGGGFPCWFNNMDLLLKSGLTIYLNIENEILYQRMRALSNKRPIINGLKGFSLKRHIKNLKRKNEHIYKQAQLTYDPENETFYELINKLEITQT